MSRGNTQPMKVVFINTQYVETDATSFKSVVQRLTGKDSTVANEPMAAEFEKKTAKSSIGVRSGVDQMTGSGGGSVLSKGMSFKELDRLLIELPPLDELPWRFTG